MTKRPLAAIAVAVSLIGLTACSGTYQDRLTGTYATSFKRGSDALRANNFGYAADQYEFAASSGHPKALVGYGRLFVKGQGVDQDPARAEALFEQAYGKPSSYKGKAALELGLLLLDGGQGPSGTVERDEARARELLIEALDSGERRAAPKLGRIYERGLGVDADPDVAIDYYRQAAPNDAFAARDLARLLSKTGAADQEIANAAERAVNLFEARAEAGNGSAWVQLADIYARDEIVDPDPERAKGYLANVSDPDDPAMQRRLAGIYGRIGERQDRNRLLRRAADAGDVGAQARLAKLFLEPGTPDTNGAVGRYYAERAIGQDNTSAMLYLGLAMLRGDVIEYDAIFGESLLRRAMDGGHLGASAALGSAILGGVIQGRTPEEGKTLLVAAAEKGSGRAMSTLGFGYLNGRGLPEDEALALDWLRKAADAGDRRAREFLADREEA
jgi:TPR repeat protein